MKLLLLSPFALYPPRHGTGSRLYLLSRALQARHAVTVVFFDRPERISSSPAPPDLDVIGLPLVEHRSGRLRRWGSRFGLLRRSAASAANLAALRDVISSRSIEAVVCQDLALAPLLPVLRGLPTLWVAEGIFSDLHDPALRPRRNLYRRAQDWVVHRKWRRLEAWAWRQADVLVAVSEVEARSLRARTHGRQPVVLAPNAVPVDELASVPRNPAAPPRILFVGSAWQPNVEGLNYFASAILPLVRAEAPDLVLGVAGGVGASRDLRLANGDGIEILGFVDDLRQHYASSSCIVVPILHGHGTRVKILEAMAAGVPVVSTSKGAEGLELTVGEEILIADHPDEFARAVLALTRDSELAARIGAAGRARVRRDYDSRHAAGPIESALEVATRLRRNRRP